MTIERIKVGPRMSQAVIHHDTVYLAGQVAGDASADVAGQTRQILSQIEALLADILQFAKRAHRAHAEKSGNRQANGDHEYRDRQPRFAALKEWQCLSGHGAILRILLG